MAVKVLPQRFKTRAPNAREMVCSLCIVVGGSACSKAPTPYEWNLPNHIPAPTVPADNPMTVEERVNQAGATVPQAEGATGVPTIQRTPTQVANGAYHVGGLNGGNLNHV